MTEYPTQEFDLPQATRTCGCGKQPCLLHWRSTAADCYQVRCFCGEETQVHTTPVEAFNEWQKRGATAK